MAVSSEIIELMQKLKNMTIENGCTPAEAENAAARLSNMLERYQLSITDIASGEIKEGVVEDSFVAPEKRWRRSAITFANNVAAAYDCKVVYFQSRLMGSGYFKISFIGIESDVKVAAFIFESLRQPIWDAGKAKAKQIGYTGGAVTSFCDQFLSGAGAGILRRITSERTAFADVPAIPGQPPVASSTALVPIKQQKVKEHMDQKHGKLKTDTYRQTIRDGFADGVQHGMNMEIRKGIEGGKQRFAGALGGGQ